MSKSNLGKYNMKNILMTSCMNSIFEELLRYVLIIIKNFILNHNIAQSSDSISKFIKMESFIFKHAILFFFNIHRPH